MDIIKEAKEPKRRSGAVYFFIRLVKEKPLGTVGAVIVMVLFIVGIFADWVDSQTECWILDASYSEYTGEPWYPDTVRTLAEQWPRVCEIEEKKARIIAYIEEHPKKRFV